MNGNGFTKSLGNGFMTGLTAGLSNGLLTGLNDGLVSLERGYLFWNGEKKYDFKTFLTAGQIVLSRYMGEKASDPIELDQTLHMRVYNELGLQVGDYGVQEMTTKAPKGRTLNNYDGFFMTVRDT